MKEKQKNKIAIKHQFPTGILVLDNKLVFKGIGLGYVSTPFKNIGTELNIEIRGRKKKATVVKAPFYTKGSLLA